MKPGITLNRNEKILSCLICIAALFAFERVVATPWKTRESERAQEISVARIKLETDQRAYEEMASRPGGAVRQPASLPFIEHFDRSNDRFSKVVTDLTRETQAAPLKLRRFSTEKPSTTSDYTRSIVSLDVDASFPAIGKFLERLGDLPILAEVESLEIYRVENDLKKCSARIRLLSYVVNRP